ncbi:Fanconi anemia group D2 protein-like [Xenia sp. Carnegie-2017]|uniref:Fanconi anemia group D2 protein-like n=1 Tax=Xenia sp. Carnegie-2017 TaxID=2897299 RepID=UPI001F037F88|nr:Fanconi anemia group D2 protein-like [Xenia sp. Carnegie-2017]
MLKSRKRNPDSNVLVSSSVSNNKKQKKGEENGNLYERDMQSIFEKMVTRSGVELSYDDEPNKLNVEQALCQRNLSKAIKKHNYPQVINDFIEGFVSYIEDPQRKNMVTYQLQTIMLRLLRQVEFQ